MGRCVKSQKRSKTYRILFQCLLEPLDSSTAPAVTFSRLWLPSIFVSIRNSLFPPKLPPQVESEGLEGESVSEEVTSVEADNAPATKYVRKRKMKVKK
jgi:hypothetical protein